MTAEINGQSLGSHWLDNGVAGPTSAGLVVFPYSDGPADVRFDNFAVRSLDGSSGVADEPLAGSIATAPDLTADGAVPKAWLRPFSD